MPTTKASFIPALSQQRQRQQQDEEAARTRADSVNEKLNRSRLAARQRRDPLCHSSTTSSSASLPRSNISSTYITSSSSSSPHVGLKFFSATEAKQLDTEEEARARAIRRMYAGPAPPQSWQGSGPPSASTSNNSLSQPASLSQSLPITIPPHAIATIEQEAAARNPDMRSLVMSCRERDRQVIAPWQTTRPSWTTRPTVPSLRMITAAYLVDLLHHAPSPTGSSPPTNPETRQAAAQARRNIKDLPKHLKLTIMAAGGSVCRSLHPLERSQDETWSPRRHDLSTIVCLWPGSAAHFEQVGTLDPTRHSSRIEPEEAQVDDDWEEVAMVADRECNDSLADQAIVDLAFSSLPSTSARALLNPGGAINPHIRSLNLASMKLSDDFLFHVVQHGFPNLEELCLARCTPSREIPRPDRHAAGRLRRFWTTCTKIKLLDLSHVTPTLALLFSDGLHAAAHATSSGQPRPRLAQDLQDVLVKGAFTSEMGARYEKTSSWRERCAGAKIYGVSSSTSIGDISLNDCSPSSARLREYDPARLRELEAARGIRVPYWVSAHHVEWAMVHLPRPVGHTILGSLTDAKDESRADEEAMHQTGWHGKVRVRILPMAMLPIHSPDLYRQFSEKGEDHVSTGQLFLVTMRNYFGNQVDLWI